MDQQLEQCSTLDIRIIIMSLATYTFGLCMLVVYWMSKQQRSISSAPLKVKLKMKVSNKKQNGGDAMVAFDTCLEWSIDTRTKKKLALITRKGLAKIKRKMHTCKIRRVPEAECVSITSPLSHQEIILEEMIEVNLRHDAGLNLESVWLYILPEPSDASCIPLENSVPWPDIFLGSGYCTPANLERVNASPGLIRLAQTPFATLIVKKISKKQKAKDDAATEDLEEADRAKKEEYNARFKDFEAGNIQRRMDGEDCASSHDANASSGNQNSAADEPSLRNRRMDRTDTSSTYGRSYFSRTNSDASRLSLERSSTFSSLGEHSECASLFSDHKLRNSRPDILATFGTDFENQKRGTE